MGGRHHDKNVPRVVSALVFWYLAWATALCDVPGWRFILAASLSLVTLLMVYGLATGE